MKCFIWNIYQTIMSDYIHMWYHITISFQNLLQTIYITHEPSAIAQKLKSFDYVGE